MKLHYQLLLMNQLSTSIMVVAIWGSVAKFFNR